MNLSTIKGTVQSHTQKSFSLGDGGQLVDNSITIEHDGKKTVVHKYTKPETNFSLAVGTQVQASFDAQTKTGSKGDYTINKIIKDGLTILQGSTGESPAAVKSSSSSSTTNTLTALSSNSGKYDSNGARNGMIAGKGVELAIARGTTDLEGLKQAAKDVLDLTFFVESGAKLEAKVKKPKENTSKLLTKKGKTISADELDTLDSQDDSFEFEG